MFGIPTSLILYGGLALAGAGASWYVMDLRGDYAECRAANETLTERIRDQNKGIAATAKAAQDALAASQHALDAAKAKTNAVAADLAAQQAQIDKPKATTCAAALAEIRAGLK